MAVLGQLLLRRAGEGLVGLSTAWKCPMYTLLTVRYA